MRHILLSLASLGSQPVLWEAPQGSWAQPCCYNKPCTGNPRRRNVWAAPWVYSSIHIPRHTADAPSRALGSCWRRDLSSRISTTNFLLPTPFSAALGSVPLVVCSLSHRLGRVCLVPARGVSSGLAHTSGSPRFVPPAAEAPGGNSSSSSFLATSWGVFASKAVQLRMPVLLQQQQVSLSSSMS